MRTYPETPIVTRARFIFVGVVFLVLVVLAHGGAYLKAWLDLRGPAADAHTACLLQGHFHDLGHRSPDNASVVFSDFLKKRRPQHLLASILDIWLSGVSSARLLGGLWYLRWRLERRV